MDRLDREEYSVLMAVYEREKPEYFRQSIQSMLEQTLPFSDFVLVCDGPLGSRLEGVIAWAREQMGSRLQVIRLPENRGLGHALRIGVRRCRCPVIARMDSDDVSRPGRCRLQMELLAKGDCDIVSGTLQEFRSVPGDTAERRKLPESPEEIRKYAGKRNPFNHPCVMYRKEAVLAAGNYRDFPGFEDYYLWVRMLQRGCRGRNLPQVILDMRVGSGMYSRRGGRAYVKSALRFQRWMYAAGFIGPAQFLYNCAVRAGVGILPEGLRRSFYGSFLRKKS